jgi:uncharacterized protein YbaP (TraB family)
MRRCRVRVAVVAAALVFAALDAQAQAPAAGAPSVSEVVVTLPTPKVWKLTRGGSTVYIVGRIGLLPGGVPWVKAPIARIMDRADRLIVPPYFSMRSFRETLRMLQPPGKSLDAELSVETRANLHAVLGRLHKSPTSLDRYRAAPAAYQLLMLLPGGRNVLSDEPLATIRSLAEQKNLEVVEAFHGDGEFLLAALNAIPEARGLELLDKAIVQANDDLDHADAINKAWRRGDLAALREAQSRRPNPLSVITQGAPEARADLVRQETDKFLGAIEAALATPGLTVTVYNIDELGAESPLIKKLRAEGVVVIAPEG